jgi:mono/diheme cytochrome c family protein
VEDAQQWDAVRKLIVWALLAVSVAFNPLITGHATAQPAPPARPGQDRPAASADQVSQGKYVATEADCISCHSAPGGKPFAGGYPLKSPLGIIYGSNITPDQQTGIGAWTEADFDRALRRGVSKDGSYLYPAMPYEAYTKMTPADMHALWLYLRTVPAVNNTPPKNTLPFPFTVREGLAVWQAAYFKPGPFVPDAGQSAQWNRGAYLVQALGHCDQCHTPRNAAQALEKGHELAGAKISGWYAPDISNDANSKLHDLSEQQIVTVLKTGNLPGNAKVVGPMAEATHDSLRFLKTADLEAIAVYLKQQPSKAQPVEASAVKMPADRLAEGRRIYENVCSSCHQANGKGMPGSVPALAGNDTVTATEPYNVIMAMLEGFAPQGTWGAMGSFAKTLNDEQIADVANYVRTAWGNSAPPNATPWSVDTWRQNATPHNESHALLCPSLAPDVVQPALSAGSTALKQAAGNEAKMSKLVGDYRAARPRTSSAQVIEALSTAYCRTLSTEAISEARMSAEISDFAQQVAEALQVGRTSDARGPAERGSAGDRRPAG